MIEQRKETRFQALAKVKIEGFSEEEHLLKDISIIGCQVESASCSAIKLNLQYELKIIPESDAELGPFNLLVETKWIRNENHSCKIGFNIVESPKGKQFQRYVDYLSWRHSRGNGILDT